MNSSGVTWVTRALFSTATIQLRYVKITIFCRFYISAMNKYMY